MTSLQGEDIPQNYPYADHVRQQRYILSKFKEVSTYRGPKLVFIHIDIPHPPYVFNADGSLIENPPPLPWLEPLPWNDYVKYYAGQAEYVSVTFVQSASESL